MSPLSDDYIRSLEPETLRYDVTIFDDFVISVLPNGIKTWAFLYDYESRKRRKTLGVYPDMSFEEAEDALDNVRGMIVKLGDDIKDSPVDEDTLTMTIPDDVLHPPVIATPPPAPARPVARPAVLATRTRYRQKRSRSVKPRTAWVRPFALGLALVIGLGALVFVVPKLDLFDGASDAGVTKPTAGDRGPAQPISFDDPAPQPSTQTPQNSTDETPPGSDPTTLPETVGTVSTPPKPAVPSSVPRPVPAQASISQTATAQTTEPATPQPARDTASVTPRADPEPVASVPASLATPPKIPSSTDVTPPPESVSDAPPVSAAIGESQVSNTSRTTEPPETASATGGQVSRAVISSNVEDLEPVDDLGPNVVLENGGYQTVFYFTELRNFSAGNVVHRWTVNGKVIADVPLRVGGGWRWRTYSSKDLLPGMTGDWSVAVIDGDGNVLGERRFTFDR